MGTHRRLRRRQLLQRPPITSTRTYSRWALLSTTNRPTKPIIRLGVSASNTTATNSNNNSSFNNNTQLCNSSSNNNSNSSTTAVRYITPTIRAIKVATRVTITVISIITGAMATDRQHINCILLCLVTTSTSIT